MEPQDPEKFVDPDQRCKCGHERDCHDLAQGHEVCLYGWGNPDNPDPEACDCEDFDPEEGT